MWPFKKNKYAVWIFNKGYLAKDGVCITDNINDALVLDDMDFAHNITMTFIINGHSASTIRIKAR